MNKRSKNILANRSGLVLVTVVIMTVIMSILAITLISANVNQALTSRHQVNRIKADQLAQGFFWYNYMNLVNQGTAVPELPPITLDGKKYISTLTAGGVGPNGTQTYSITVPY